MSIWVHSICDQCWEKIKPNYIPHRAVDSYKEEQKCCFCGFTHFSGITIRYNAKNLKHCNQGKDHE